MSKFSMDLYYFVFMLDSEMTHRTTGIINLIAAQARKKAERSLKNRITVSGQQFKS
jgi:uncharacterized protein (UPF0333 family)